MSKKSKNKIYLMHAISYIIAISSAISAVVPEESEAPLLQIVKIVSDTLALHVKHHPEAKHMNLIECKEIKHQ